MEVKFKVTGEARKALVKAAGEALGWEPVYKGAPSFGYVVSNITISRNGTLTWDERTDEAAILHLLGKLREMGFVPAEVEIDPDTLTIEMPLAGFSEAELENLDRLIAGKAALIKKAVGADSLPVERSETTLKFPWFKFGIDGATVAAYSRFIGALCAAAKEQKRVTGREKAVENEKYAFRVFLLRLGFVGDDYKEARKILLKNLSGNSAFKSGAPAKTEVDADA